MRRLIPRIWFLGLAAVAFARIASADPAPAAPVACEAAGPQESAALAEKLFDKGEYQHAGACYQAAGDMAHANLAFIKAVGPGSEDTSRALKAQRDTAKKLVAQVEQAFHRNH